MMRKLWHRLFGHGDERYLNYGYCRQFCVCGKRVEHTEEYRWNSQDNG